MDEYISKEAVLKHLNECKEDPLFDPDMARICFAISIFIEEMQAADVQPVKRGKWEELTDYGGWGDTHYRCSVCGEEWHLEDGTPQQNNMNFCPRCGSRMDGDY